MKPQFEEIPAGDPGGKKPSLLLHACCAPCGSAVLECLAPLFDLTIFYYNPNISPPEEYRRRLSELRAFIRRFAPAARCVLVEAPYDPQDFYRATGVREAGALQTEPERGIRCERCYRLRLKAAHRYATEHGFDYVTTTLSISPHKDAVKINAIGKTLAQAGGAAFLWADFKKQGGFQRSLVLSAEYGLYRQSYCGCEYSLRNH
ncbi:MAG: epoxyqueuosine reductase QueH [Spirochaetaceae bacterium]|jgi:predicted adenine nucleotide alpha hydrolase (AANH) superfamily ATPase|nr:epoxyqueuosine reductase QueH [Spirochaetaceae bacterium]